jgi:hypothetical protein
MEHSYKLHCKLQANAQRNALTSFVRAYDLSGLIDENTLKVFFPETNEIWRKLSSLQRRGCKVRRFFVREKALAHFSSILTELPEKQYYLLLSSISDFSHGENKYLKHALPLLVVNPASIVNIVEKLFSSETYVDDINILSEDFTQHVHLDIYADWGGHGDRNIYEVRNFALAMKPA